jgi:hypothetical protein
MVWEVSSCTAAAERDRYFQRLRRQSLCLKNLSHLSTNSKRGQTSSTKPGPVAKSDSPRRLAAARPKTSVPIPLVACLRHCATVGAQPGLSARPTNRVDLMERSAGYPFVGNDEAFDQLQYHVPALSNSVGSHRVVRIADHCAATEAVAPWPDRHSLDLINLNPNLRPRIIG